MQNPIDIALMHVNNVIFPEILDAVFEPIKRQLALDYCIFQEVIEKRVLKDANIAGGTMTSITLTPEMIEDVRYENFGLYNDLAAYAVYRIPPEKREYKNITTAISVSYPYLGYGAVPYGGVMGSGTGCNTYPLPNMTNLACQTLFAANGAIYGVPKPTPILRHGNLIELAPAAGTPLPGFMWLLSCRLEYDKEFTNLNISAIDVFRKLVEYAVKSYIYTTSLLKIDKFQVTGGVEWGEFKRVIDSYADAEEKYEEQRLFFQDTAVKIDPEFRRKLLYMQV